jgi:hypothetical protein
MNGHDRARARADADVMRSGSMVSRHRIDVANTGRAPVIMIASAVYAAESGERITSSPAPMPSARRISAIAYGSVAGRQPRGGAGRRPRIRVPKAPLGVRARTSRAIDSGRLRLDVAASSPADERQETGSGPAVMRTPPPPPARRSGAQMLAVERDRLRARPSPSGDRGCPPVVRVNLLESA